MTVGCRLPAAAERQLKGAKMRTKILAFVSAVAMGAAAAAATPAAAAQYQFNYQSTSGLFGAPPQTLQGVFTTSDTAVDRFGRTAFVITGITGTLNNLAITGLFEIANNPYYYFTSGGTFLDGSGVRFNAGFTNVAFFQPSVGPADQYRINGGGGISTLGNATSSPVNAAVPEPATWAMMMLGFGAMGFAMRRRQNMSARIRFA